MSVITIDHLTKHIKKRLKKGDYGSVLITIQDGIVTGVNDQESFNPTAFCTYVDKPVIRLAVRNKPVNEKADSTDVCINSTKDGTVLQNNAKILQQDKTKNESIDVTVKDDSLIVPIDDKI